MKMFLLNPFPYAKSKQKDLLLYIAFIPFLYNGRMIIATEYTE